MSISRRSLLKFSGFLGGAALATGLGAFKTPLAQAQTAPPNPTLIMQLDWVFNVQFAGLLLADHLGLYTAKGVNVVIKPWESNVVVPEVVAANPLTIGCAEQNLILEAQAQGVPLKAIATMFQASPYALMTMPDSGITTLEGLVGKRVGIHVDGVKIMELIKGVSNLAADAIEVVEIPYENKLDRLISGEFDAIQCYAVDEPVGFARRVGQAPLLIPVDEYGYRAYAQVFFATDALLQQYPTQVEAFLAASFEGWQMALADIPGTARLIAEKYAAPNSKYTDVEYQTQSLRLVGEYIMRGIDPAQIGQIEPDRWMETADLMVQYDIIGTRPDPQDSLNLSLWGTAST
ncbi:ABC transporter substrate-binding protein [Oscillatoria sp. FACHB-1407]|uniref:ABC transporter substrate-binding protein n=1 Tax=Oscillatoria sp. FACHB-1407 TaxID=2692847 RepID=UPI001687879D|nr:ABC transporter substrate-binding protein [Oscillatoria sp. FACHB-1407]MBD2460682.1 ABC transporter substrate-binding protein [Oscillatoria sp. FACHB-1407]